MPRASASRGVCVWSRGGDGDGWIQAVSSLCLLSPHKAHWPQGFVSEGDDAQNPPESPVSAGKCWTPGSKKG